MWPHVAESGATQEGGNGREVRLCGRIAGTSMAIHLRISVHTWIGSVLQEE